MWQGFGLFVFSVELACVGLIMACVGAWGLYRSARPTRTLAERQVCEVLTQCEF